MLGFRTIPSSNTRASQENAFQHKLGHFGATFKIMLPIHQNFGFDNGNQIAVLTESSISRQRLSIRLNRIIGGDGVACKQTTSLKVESAAATPSFA